MSIVEKIKSWLGSDETYDEGFDELFKLESGLNNPATNNNKIISSNNLNPEVNLNNISKLKSKESLLQSSNNSVNSHLKILDNSLSATNEVVVLEPTSFSQAPEVLQYLRKGSSVVLNLCKLNSEESQRLVDFVCGGIYALDGSQRRVGEGVFLLVPSSVNINSVENRESKLLHSFWAQRE